MKRLNLKADLHDLCDAIVQFFYVSRNRIFSELKQTYQKNTDAYNAFRSCVSKHLYFPCGILLCAFKICICNEFLDTEKIAMDLGKLISIHRDHLQFLCDVIYTMIINDDTE